MHLIDAIQTYTHLMQASDHSIDARIAADKHLRAMGVSKSIRDAIADMVSIDGKLIGPRGETFALTQMSSS